MATPQESIPQARDTSSEVAVVQARLEKPSPFALRAQLEDMVVKDLHGPAGGPEEEVAEDRVSERYLVGVLAPRRQRLQPETMDGVATAGTESGEEGVADSQAPPTTTLAPSSLGLTFCVDSKAASFCVTARWGQYLRTKSETKRNAKGEPENVWKRIPREEKSPPIPLREGAISPWTVSDEQPDVFVQGRIRKFRDDYIVTIFLVNNQDEPKRAKDVAWLFQPELIVESPDGSPIFCRRTLLRDPERLDPVDLAEEKTMAMLYRKRREFAVGHGVSVTAEPSDEDPSLAVRLSTVVVPAYEVWKQTPRTAEDDPLFAGLVLDMKELSQTPDAEFSTRLQPLVVAYRAWIEAERQRAGRPGEELGEFVDTARESLTRCEKALSRIEAGIELLGRDSKAAEAFRFANKAMWLQRTRSLYALAVRRGSQPILTDIDVPDNRRWYPFQLAFILLNLPGITQLDHPDRSESASATADLLWFPTGGGKTEAYLGLTAYTLGIRRLQGEVAGRAGEDGVAVLMRYTLRLLTLQQFQRASALICACEIIRREAEATGEPMWGTTPFRIGLWVGQRSTPNTTEQAAEAINEERNPSGGGVGGVGTPCQLTYCPWCGTFISPGKHIRVLPVSSDRGRTLIFCGDDMGDCPFSERQSPVEGLPVVVVDEEIYRLLPALLIATVDKFAQMPWKGETQMLFGQVNGYCPRHGYRSPELPDSDSHPRRGELDRVQTEPRTPLRPPDLIIQDELHLISGPLGTLVGIYETAVDALCTWQVDGHAVRPKVIASTATIRRAGDQVNALFMRRVEVFPPNGLDIKDNFFSIQRAPSADNPGRRYLGICALGKRYPVALIRVYVAFLAAAQKLYETCEIDADAWMTLAGYFNSIRELGGTRRLVEDDVRSRLRDTDQRGLAKRRQPFLRELTSRVSAAEIPAVLDLLEVPFDPQKDALRAELLKQGKMEDAPPRPIDVLLATNMISVGVDVDRLGLMVVAGQPKYTSEYIQATSRVGRKRPGLVCTVYNWARPRDLSHYERFEHYHATFYKNVEALSVTPFAPRAQDRGLSAALVALTRLPETRYNANLSAAKVDRNDPMIQSAIDTIVNRAEAVTGLREVGDVVRRGLLKRLDMWDSRIRTIATGTRLGYEQERDGVTVGLLSKPEVADWDWFTCLNALRDVEPNVGLVLVEDGGLDERSPASMPFVSADTIAKEGAPT